MGQEKELRKRRAKRAFTAAQKADAVRVVKSGKSVAQVAREFDLTATSLHEWVRRAEADGGERRNVLTTEEREELSRLRREVKHLLRERDILKAAATFFAKESA